jgi:hypothetical protein
VQCSWAAATASLHPNSTLFLLALSSLLLLLSVSASWKTTGSIAAATASEEITDDGKRAEAS